LELDGWASRVRGDAAPDWRRAKTPIVIRRPRDARQHATEPLKEVQLANLFGVKRGLIRKVLTRLAHSRLVDQTPNRGATVAKPSVKEGQDLFATRRVIESAILETLIDQPAIDETQLLEQASLREWGEALQRRLNQRSETSVSYKVSVKGDEDSNLYGLIIDKRLHGILSQYELSSDFLRSADYQAVARFVDQVSDLFADGSYVSRGERRQPVAKFSEAYSWLMKEARKGLNIQRYKGLGEMNPDQLWETTMDPGNRRLLRVRIEDAIAADEVFTTLMGDQVEPRRVFIKSNALKVVNLDV